MKNFNSQITIGKMFFTCNLIGNSRNVFELKVDHERLEYLKEIADAEKIVGVFSEELLVDYQASIVLAMIDHDFEEYRIIEVWFREKFTNFMEIEGK